MTRIVIRIPRILSDPDHLIIALPVVAWRALYSDFRVPSSVNLFHCSVILYGVPDASALYYTEQFHVDVPTAAAKMLRPVCNHRLLLLQLILR